MNYWQVFLDGYKGYANYFWYEITHPGWHNYFYWLILVSAFFLALEWIKPWRKDQPRFRKDFWLDFFYMFFNFFLFSLIIYNAASNVVVNFLNGGIYSITGINLPESNSLYRLPLWTIMILAFIVRDFIQWWVHRLLHRSAILWRFHQVHHSVEQMGFAAHLRYHWMETIVYRMVEYIPLAILFGINLYDFFILHIFSLAIGHYNHSNISVPGWITGGVFGALISFILVTGAFEIELFAASSVITKGLAVAGGVAAGALLLGPIMKRVFNNPEMHIWHHSYYLPKDKQYGVNFGISLAIWDYVFGTVYIPYNGRDIKLGFPGLDQFPKTFGGQIIYGFDGDRSSLPSEFPTDQAEKK